MRRNSFTLATILAMLLSGNPSCANTHSQSAQPGASSQASAAEATRPLPHPGLTQVGNGARAASIADVVERVLPSVVSVSSTRTARVGPSAMPFDNPFFHHFFGPRFDVPHQRRAEGLGSGVVVAPNVILTNNHVVDGAEEIKISTVDRQELDAELVGADPKSDLAVLRLKEKDAKLKPIQFGSSSRLRLGDVVIAIGNPFGVGQTVTMGIVSAKGRAHLGIVDYEDFIQTDAAINPGNSGGALVNTEGRLVGINTAILSRSGGNVGIGFAIPTDMAKPIMDSIMTTGKVVRGWLGVSIQDLNADLAKALGVSTTRGVLVAHVEKDTPAAKGGVERGDIILKVNGEAVKTTSELRNLIAATGAGTEVKLDLLRDDKPRTVTVKLGEMPNDVETAAPAVGVAPGKPSTIDGLTLQPLDAGLRKKYEISQDVTTGLVVTDIKRGSVGAFAGLRPGDVLLEVNRQSVKTPEDFKRAWKKSSDKVLFLVYRKGTTIFMAVTKPKK
jgi:serine protease Do